MARDRDDRRTANGTDDDSGRSTRDALGRFIAGRPTWGALALALGSGAVAWRVGTALAAADGVVTPAGWAGLVAPLLGVGLALVALVRPSRATLAGLSGTAATLAAVTGMLVANVSVAHPKLLFTALLVAGVGGVFCVGWTREGPSVRVALPGGVARSGRQLLVVGLAVLLVVSATPAASGETFPQQMDALGGFVVAQSTLDAGWYSFQPDCPDQGTNLLNPFAEKCLDITVDSSNVSLVNRAARQQLDNRHGADVVLSDFLIYKNFWVTRDDVNDVPGNPQPQFVNFELKADSAVATSWGPQPGSLATNTNRDEQPRAIDIYMSEMRTEALTARVDLVNITGYPGFPLDNIQTWTCNPQDAAGFGSINDRRLGLDANPRLTDGRDAALLAHELGSTKTTLTNFELTVAMGKHQDVPGDAPPTAPQDDCL
ncbi:MAG: hypothetical protein ABEJ31_05255 [Haloarculaceae archaeon]